MNRQGESGQGAVLAAYAAVYLIWGSTYLAIRFAIESMPPLLMSGIRFVLAGTLMYAWIRWRGAGRPRREHWISAAIVGSLLLAGGNGAVAWAEQTVPSGLVALLVAIVPIVMVALDWARGGGRPTRQLIAALALGLLGVSVLIGPEELLGGGSVNPLGAGVVLLGTLSWAVGSIYSRTAPFPPRALQSTAMQMLCGGAVLVLMGLVGGEAAAWDVSAVTGASLLALAYLIGMGSWVAYSAYIFLLRRTTPARASTYAYVNPMIAVLLGWLLADEPLNARVLLAVLIIVPAVALIIWVRATPGAGEPTAAAQPPGPAARG